MEDSSENNEPLRGACPERDSSVASLLQNDKGEGLRVTEEKDSRVKSAKEQKSGRTEVQKVQKCTRMFKFKLRRLRNNPLT